MAATTHKIYSTLARHSHLRFGHVEHRLALEGHCTRLLRRYGILDFEDRKAGSERLWDPQVSSEESNPAIAHRVLTAIRLFAMAQKSERVLGKRGLVTNKGEVNGLLSHLDRFYRSSDSIVAELEVWRERERAKRSKADGSYIELRKAR